MALKDQVRMLEEEKNALLDYIEESVNISKSAISPTKDGNADTNELVQNHHLTLNDLQS